MNLVLLLFIGSVFKEKKDDEEGGFFGVFFPLKKKGEKWLSKFIK